MAQNLIEGFRDAMLQLPELLQPLLLAAAGAVPFIEGEGATVIGALGGINPLIAALAGFAGNLLCVVLIVILGARTRGVVVGYRGRRVEARRSELATSGAGLEADAPATQPAVPVSRRRAKFQRALSRWGVPGVSLLGPFLLPTQFTAATLAGLGVEPRRIIFWQAISIAGWTAVAALLISLVLSSVQ